MKRPTREFLRARGEQDAFAGKPVDAFQELPGRLTESMRAEYEIGFRAAKDHLRTRALREQMVGRGIRKVEG